jgi:probable HAF family extracellular repeat protein
MIVDFKYIKLNLRLLLSLTLTGLTITLNSQVAEAAYQFTLLDTLGSSVSGANAINNSGQIVGWTYTSNFDTIKGAMLWNGGTATTLDNIGYYSEALDINNSGQIVGYSSTNSGGRATLWNGTSAIELDTLGGINTSAKAINNSCQVAGYIDAGNVITASVWNGTKATKLTSLGGNYSDGLGINDSGQIVGVSNATVFGNLHATIWNGTTATELDSLGGDLSVAFDINNSGQAIGYSRLDYVNTAMLWNDTTPIRLGVLGGYSSAFDINNSGQVVGFSVPNFDGTKPTRATLWNGTTEIDLNSFLDASTVSEGWLLTEARQINDNGWIVGQAVNSYGLGSRAFLLTPVPEPETFTMFIAGLGLFGLIRLRRKIS